MMQPLTERQIQIVSGKAGLPAEKVQQYRELYAKQGHSLPAVDMQALEAAQPNRRKPANRNVISHGPGTELLAIFKLMGMQECQTCRELARKMDAWGVAGCRERLDWIVGDITSRAGWFKTLKRPAIRTCVTLAIDRAEAKSGAIASYTLADVTIVVTCFLRFEKLRTFLQSVREHYPGIPVIVSDNSLREDEPYPPDVADLTDWPGVNWIRCPFDVGVTGVRNLAFPHVQTRLTVLCEEDFVFTGETDLQAMVDVLNTGEVDLCAGLCREDGHARNWSGWWDRRGKQISMRALDSAWQFSGKTAWRRTDSVLNFFCAKTQLLVDNPGDSQFKASHEHLDWMLTWQQAGMRVAYTPACIVAHDRGQRSERYNRHRKRTFREELYKKWGIDAHSAIAIQWEPAARIAPEPTRSQNVILLTVGHTGSTIVADLYRRLGWNLPDNDPEFNEPVSVRHLNSRDPDAKELQSLLARFSQPWLLKDPRFCETLEQWLPALAPYRPELVWLERDHSAVRESYHRRGEDPAVADRRLQAAERHYHYWPWTKRKVLAPDLADWAAAIDPGRL